ncbi:unnamed protein product [Pieris macdunnoughi]|uniref:Uncharacterized protein n=1 Tax=Pieris macdunnoughi TaxID=345717 RepID=A0A821Q0I7_9NEOP|nr:unnamed protein product [Pieris macdunnoughi]
MNAPCFASSPYIFHTISDGSSSETDDSSDSGCEKIVEGFRTKYNDPKRRTINKVSKKILRAIERLTCSIKRSVNVKKANLAKRGKDSFMIGFTDLRKESVDRMTPNKLGDFFVY